MTAAREILRDGKTVLVVACPVCGFELPHRGWCRICKVKK